ncbi:unnamed protein product [Amaranthus hypochondriacus]
MICYFDKSYAMKTLFGFVVDAIKCAAALSVLLLRFRTSEATDLAAIEESDIVAAGCCCFQATYCCSIVIKAVWGAAGY